MSFLVFVKNKGKIGGPEKNFTVKEITVKETESTVWDEVDKEITYEKTNERLLSFVKCTKSLYSMF